MSFKAGRNIAIKLPERDYADTLVFYRDTLGFNVLEEHENGAIIEFGHIRLNLDRVPHQSQTDVWFEIETPDTVAAAKHLERSDVTRCDEVEALPKGFDGFWVAAPAGTIHLISGTTKNGA